MSGDVSGIRRRISLARMTRALAVAGTVIEAIALTAFLAAGMPAVALMMAFAGVLLAVNVVWQTVLIGRLQREDVRLLHDARPRPDYAAIARMETVIWGEAFAHAGAPAVAAQPRPYVTWNEARERVCPWCPADGCWHSCAGRNPLP